MSTPDPPLGEVTMGTGSGPSTPPISTSTAYCSKLENRFVSGPSLEEAAPHDAPGACACDGGAGDGPRRPTARHAPRQALPTPTKPRAAVDHRRCFSLSARGRRLPFALGLCFRLGVVDHLGFMAFSSAPETAANKQSPGSNTLPNS